MNRCIRYILLSGFFILAGCLNSRGSFIFHKITLPAEFNGNVIRIATYDKAGMVWFVTNSGLHRYDGNEVVSFNLQTTPSIDYTSIQCMATDDAGNLWLGTKHGVIQFNLIAWTIRLYSFGNKAVSADKTDETIYSLCKIKKGLLLAGAANGKLFRIQNGRMEEIFDAHLYFGNTYDRPTINTIIQAGDGTVWISVKGHLVHLDLSGKVKPESYKLPESENGDITYMLYDSVENRIFFSRFREAYTLDCQTKKISQVLKLSRPSKILSANLEGKKFLLVNFLDKEKAWLSLFDYSANKFIDSIPTLRVWMKTIDCRKNKILLSNDVGLWTLTWKDNSIRVKLKSDRQGGYNSIRTMFKTASDQLLVSTYKDHLIQLDLNTGQTKEISWLRPYAMLRWNADSVLIGDEGKGLLWYEIKSQHTKPILLKTERMAKDPPRQRYITCLFRQADSTVWVGTFQGLFLANVYNYLSWDLLRGPLAEVVRQTRVSAVMPLGNGWVIATNKGLFRFNKTGYEVNIFSDSLNGRGCYSLQTVNHQIWAGSDGLGLVVLDSSGHVLREINYTNGLAGNTVYSLQRWRDYMVVGTDRGLSIIYLPDMKIKNFTTYDGLPSNECNYSALLATDSGIYLGTTNGLIMFNVEKLFKSKNDSIIDLINITSLKTVQADGKARVDYSFPYKHSDRISIPSGTSFFSITLGNLNDLSRFREVFYRLSPNEPWHEITNKTAFSFVNTAPGTYYLEIAGTTSNRQWMTNLFAKKLEVLPMYYQTNWFKTLILIATLCLLVFLVRLIIRYRESQKEKERLIRLQIAGDLHDEVGSTLAGISMQADMLLRGRLKHQDKYLKNITNDGRSAVNTMGDIVWSIDPRNDDQISLINRMERYGEKTMSPTGIRFIVNADGVKERRFHLPQAVRQNIMLIYKEALTNISKHADASQVHLSFKMEGRKLKIVIADDGRGFSPNNTNGHGLRNIQMRAERIGAELDLPNVDKGVTITLKVKV